MILLLGIMVLIMAFSAKLTWTLVREVPLADRSFSTASGTQFALEVIRQDVERAGALKMDASDAETAAFTLTGTAGPVTYALRPGGIWRTAGTDDPNLAAPPAWNLPDTRFECRTAGDPAAPAALEIRVWQQRKVLGSERVHFKQSNLFFVGLEQDAKRDE